MPGFAGFIAKGPRDENRRMLDLMVKCMAYEQFYASGKYLNEDLSLWIGWTCLEGSFADCLPIWNERKDIALIFAGENYTDQAEIHELRARGHQFGSENASYLVHLYEEIGIRFLEKLNGLFSGVLIDIRKQKVVLFNDRYGFNRIYFHENDRGFYFSSEAKSLLKVLPEVRRLDPASLGEFFSCGCVLGNRTLFSGISLVPGGSAWTFTPHHSVSRDTYFKRESWETQPLLSEENYYENLRATWERILPRYFHGDERVGLSLTGGVDSRMILAWAPCGTGMLPCYTWGGKYRDCADVKIARELAKICHQPHETISLDSQFLSKFTSLAERAVFVSDGCMDVTGSVDLYVQALARKIAPVRLSGVYGGEVLRRLVAFKPTSLSSDLFDPGFACTIHDAVATYAAELRGHRLSFSVFKQAPWHIYGPLSLERSQLTLRAPYFDNDLVALAYQSPRALEISNEPSLRLIADGKPALKGIRTDRGLSLRSGNGLVRAQHLLKQFTFKAEYAYDHGMPQWMARLDHAFAPLHLERLFLGRHKIHHFRVWYRDEFSEYLSDILLDSRTRSRSHLRPAVLEKMVRSHIAGHRNNTLAIHKILTAELIQRQLIEQN